MTAHISQIIGHSLIVAIYIAAPVGYMWAGTLNGIDDSFWAFVLVSAAYTIGHLISAGVIK